MIQELSFVGDSMVPAVVSSLLRCLMLFLKLSSCMEEFYVLHECTLHIIDYYF